MTPFSEVVAKYTQEVRTLGFKILELLCEGLGLDPKYCYGSPKHRDPNLVTILLQENDIKALQIFKDGEWIVVEPIPYVFVVIVGLMLQIISNGRFMGVEHRVVTNSGVARTTIAYFIRSKDEHIVEPAMPLTSLGVRPIYRSIAYEEFLRIYMTKGPLIEPQLLL
ncbi:Protein DOWNY MILDEW RESISTANCE 6, partial [Mucuna pruriens]